MHTLIVSSWDLRAAEPLGRAARDRNWATFSVDEARGRALTGGVTVYSGTDRSNEICRSFGVQLMSPALDMLVHVPESLRLRSVRTMTVAAARSISGRWFIKPADPEERVFDAGVYNGMDAVFLRKPLPDDFQLLIAEPVEFSVEYRLFMKGSQIVTGSPYMIAGRPIWQPYGNGGENAVLNPHLDAFVAQLVRACGAFLPETYVVDVGLIEGRGWAVVEFNPVWCSGLLGADPAKVLDLLKIATIRAKKNR